MKDWMTSLVEADRPIFCYSFDKLSSEKKKEKNKNMMGTGFERKQERSRKKTKFALLLIIDMIDDARQN